MIPPILHYCWFGEKPLPEKYQPYLDSWRRHMPRYLIQQWNENSQPWASPYVRQNLAEGNWAFVSDYVRFQVLHEKGGIYLDTDVELLQSLPEFGGSAFLGFENVLDRVSKNPLGTAILAFAPGHPLCLAMMQAYDRNPAARPLGTDLLTRLIRKKGLAQLRNHPTEFEYLELEEIRIYHSDVLYPDMRNRFPSRELLPAKTRAIHHVAGSWSCCKLDPLPWYRRLYDYRIDRKILRPIEKAVKICLRKR